MTTQTEALKLALEALDGVLDDAPKVLDASISGGLYEVVQCREAITAIKEALAQPEQEPAAIQYASKAERDLYEMEDEDDTTPPQRTWVRLSEEEVEACFHHVDEAGIGLFDFAEAIEAKLKEKNT